MRGREDGGGRRRDHRYRQEQRIQSWVLKEEVCRRWKGRGVHLVPY